MPRPLHALPLLAFITTVFAIDPASLERGAQVYNTYCFACHQPNGQGLPGVIPPLANSDFLVADKDRSIRIALQGLAGEIKVNGTVYNGAMPALDLSDEQAADVLTYVRASFGNQAGPVSAEEVAAVRLQLVSTDNTKGYLPLPAAPAGMTLREVARMPVNPVRLAPTPGGGELYVGTVPGDLYLLNPATRNLARIVEGRSYAPGPALKFQMLGMTVDRKHRLYLVTNERLPGTPWQANLVTIYRSAPIGADNIPREIKPWLRTMYPHGIGIYDHDVNHIAQGPDGLIYVTSGARTDAGEPGNSPTLYTGGETAETACIWRLDPEAKVPTVEVFVRGIRNMWSFAWNDRGEMFGVDNGPHEDAAEELNLLEQGKHYGFPYVMSDGAKDFYPNGPKAPAGLELTPPIPNIGPAAGGSPDHPLSTFNPHSSPAGLVFCGPDYPPALQGKFIMGRFGNTVKGWESGHDLLTLDIRPGADGKRVVHTETFLAPLARVLDLCGAFPRKLYILEYNRQGINGTGSNGPGRILELAW